MIIEELIQELQKYPPDAPVYLSKEGCKYRTQRKMHKRPRKSYHHTKRQNELEQRITKTPTKTRRQTNNRRQNTHNHRKHNTPSKHLHRLKQ